MTARMRYYVLAANFRRYTRVAYHRRDCPAIANLPNRTLLGVRLEHLSLDVLTPCRTCRPLAPVVDDAASSRAEAS